MKPPLTPKISTRRPKTAPNNFRPRPIHDNGFYDRARFGFEYWYKEPLGMGSRRVPQWQKYAIGTHKTFYGLQTTPK